jgi:hypothetical protein
MSEKQSLSKEFAAFLERNCLSKPPVTGAQIIAANDAMIKAANADPQELAARLAARRAKGPLTPLETRAVILAARFLDAPRIAAYNARQEARAAENEALRRDMRQRLGEMT